MRLASPWLVYDLLSGPRSRLRVIRPLLTTTSSLCSVPRLIAGDGGGCYFSKRQRGWFDGVRPNLLSIENPTDPGIDAGEYLGAQQRVGVVRRC